MLDLLLSQFTPINSHLLQITVRQQQLSAKQSRSHNKQRAARVLVVTQQVRVLCMRI